MPVARGEHVAWCGAVYAWVVIKRWRTAFDEEIGKASWRVHDSFPTEEEARAEAARQILWGPRMVSRHRFATEGEAIEWDVIPRTDPAMPDCRWLEPAPGNVDDPASPEEVAGWDDE